MAKITDFSKTIVALATALGSGSIAIIRVSGKDAISLVNQIFIGKNLLEAKKNTIHFGKISDRQRELDQVLVSIFKAPNSYTGEDIVEISCHANPYIVKDILDILIAHGANHAGPGEFTLRAFLNGKYDLAQAEAVADIISAKTKRGLNNSINQLAGRLTNTIYDWRNSLLDLLGLMEIDLDFADQDLTIATAQEICNQIDQLREQVDHLRNTFNYGRFFNSAIHLVIIGPPNAGKSTLMNLLIGENRAITSHVPGTTRDTIHENLMIENMFFKLVDTAGLRITDDYLEMAGIERTQKQISSSDMILYVVDISDQNTDVSFVANYIDSMHIDRKTIIVANKTDLHIDETLVSNFKALNIPLQNISALTGEGLTELKQRIIDLASQGQKIFSDEVVVTATRHHAILDRVHQHLTDAVTAINAGHGYEFATVDLREALNTLGEITGETVTDDILNRIFENFCIGK
jgi:tRNA modification GTPase